MITWRFLVWLILLISAVFAQHLRLRVFPHLIILFLLLIPVVSLGLLFLLKQKVRVHLIPHTHEIDRLRVSKWQLQIKNQSRFQPVRLLYKDAHHQNIIALNPRQQFVLDLMKPAPHTGILNPPEFELQFYDAFNLFRVPHYLKDLTQILVLPLLKTKYSLVELGPNLINEIKQALLNQANQQDELQSIKELQYGDSMRRIHWNLSSRLSEWFVRHDSQGPQPVIEFIVYPDEVDEPTNQRDDLLDIATIQIGAFLNHQMHLNLNGEKIENLQQAKIQLAQYPLNHHPSIQSYFSFRPHSLYLVFVENLSKQIIQELSLLHNNDNHVILFVLNKDQSEENLKLASYHHLTILLGALDESN